MQSKYDVILNESCHLIAGCLMSTQIYPLADIAPPDIRRGVKADWERTKQKYDSYIQYLELAPHPFA